jgi:hypothetical protein
MTHAEHLSESVEGYFHESNKSILHIVNWDSITAENCIAYIKEDIAYSGLEKEFADFLEYLDTHVQDVESELNSFKKTSAPNSIRGGTRPDAGMKLKGNPKGKQPRITASFQLNLSHKQHIEEESHRLGISPSDYLNQVLDTIY